MREILRGIRFVVHYSAYRAFHRPFVPRNAEIGAWPRRRTLLDPEWSTVHNDLAFALGARGRQTSHVGPCPT